MIEARLEDITKNITDGKHGDCKPDDNSGYYFISCKDVHDGIVDYSNARQITEEDFVDTHRRTLLEPNDILITNSGTIGRMALVKDIPETYRTTFQKSVAIVKPDTSKVIPSFLYYRLMGCVNDFVNQSNGSAQKNLLLGTMRSFLVSYPEDKETQKRLAGILERYDDLIENNQRQIRLLEEAAQRLYKEWFVDFRFPGHENVEIIDGVPDGWKKGNVGHLFKTVLGGTPSRNIADYWGGYIPWINSGEVNKLRIIKESEFITERGLNNSSTKLMPKHTTVLAITGATLGQVSYTEIETCANQSVVGVYDETGEYSAYIYLCITNEIKKIISEAIGGAQQHINKEVVNKFEILLPSFDVNERIQAIVGPMFDKITNLYFEIERLSEARDRLLPKLMSGEIEL